jgi:hypothetical protein
MRARVRARRAVLGLVLTLLAVFMLLESERSSGDPPVTVAISVDTRHPGAPVPPQFLGLSFELSSLGQLGALATHGDLVALLRAFGPGLLRFGGVSADTRVAWTEGRAVRPAWASSVLGPGELRLLAQLATRTGWHVLLTLGLAHYNARAAAREVAAAKRALGPWLSGIEVGNEPDAYEHHRLRPLPWTSAQYAEQVAGYRHAIARVARDVAIAGPDASGSHAFADWGASEVRSVRPALLTGHHYPLGCAATPPPSIERLLSVRVRREEAASLARYMSVSRRSGIRLRLDEANSVSCGGVAGVSNTFASALWAVSYIAKTMAAGVSGINLHGNPGRCSGYSPLCAATPARLTAGALVAQPEWYSLLLASRLIGERPVRTKVATPHPNLSVTGLLGPHRRLQFVIIDDEPPGRDPTALSLHVGGHYRAASVLSLTAPGPAATSGVQLGGNAVARDGTWHAPADLPQIPVRGGAVGLTLAPSSAALVTVTR